MADYVFAINNSVGGQMMIRDTGSSVEFWIRSGNTAAWDASVGWSGTVNNVGVGGSFNSAYPGATWRQIAGWGVSYNQTVVFSKEDSGTQGLGGATTVSVGINRSTVPGAPSKVSFSEVGLSSMKTSFVGYTDGGSAMLDWQLAIGIYPSGPLSSGTSYYSNGQSGVRVVSGLQPGTLYAAWARGRNANGWGAWGPGNTQRTANVAPGTPSSKNLTGISHYAMTFEFDDPPSNGGTAITLREYQYSSNSSFSGASVIAAPSTGVVTRTDLAAGTLYYWRGRVQNAQGASAWSTIRSATTHSAPDAPISQTPYGITHTGMTFNFDDPADIGGTAITAREYQSATNSSFTGVAVAVAPSNGIITRTDLVPGVTYYWRARVKNSAGTSAWSITREAPTLGGARIRIGGVWQLAIPYIRVSGVWKPAVPYVKVSGAWNDTS